MEDRIVQYPQRYQLKKIEGTDDIYDLIPAPGEITAEGTLINKSALLKGETAALFKDIPEDPVPDDVFKVLSKAALLNSDGELENVSGEVMSFSKIATGSYIGTGNCKNPVSITAPFKPKILIVSIEGLGLNTNYAFGGYPWIYGQTHGTSVDTGNGIGRCTISWSGNTVSWKSYNGEYEHIQLNENGKKYLWVAVA